MEHVVRQLYRYFECVFKQKIVLIGFICFCVSLTYFSFQKETGRIFHHQVKPLKIQYAKPALNTNSKSYEIDKEIENNKVMPRNRTLWKSLPPGTQMGKEQVAAIIKVLPQTGNLLVWGLGHDSPFWHDSSHGKVIFIEPKGFWFDKIKTSYPYLEAYPVNYTTDTEKSFHRYINNPKIWFDLDLRSQLPPVVTHTSWDVIIVDAPPGYKGAPGRYQSIYTSSLIAENGTHIFVDDFERKVEKEFSLKMLGTPVEVVHRKAKGYIGSNQQAHFVFSKRK